MVDSCPPYEDKPDSPIGGHSSKRYCSRDCAVLIEHEASTHHPPMTMAESSQPPTPPTPHQRLKTVSETCKFANIMPRVF
jgi:hypothetical protein